MKALITGISGFVGPHLAAHLVNIGVGVYGIGRSATAPALSRELARRYRAVDLLDPKAVRLLIKEVRPDAIVHLAGMASPSLSWADPARFFENNVVGQINLLEAVVATALDPLILIVGSNEEYGAVDADHLPTDESAPLRPPNPYAATKVAQDMVGYQYFAGRELKIVRVRPFNHTGPGQDPIYVTPAFAGQIAKIEAGLLDPVVRVGNLDAERDFSDVRDVVRAYWLALTKGTPGEVYNVGSGRSVTIRYLLDCLLDSAKVQVKVEQDPDRMRPSDIPVTRCDAGKLRAATGWTTKYVIETTLKDVLDDWRARARQ